jgi:hypothetical protein
VLTSEQAKRVQVEIQQMHDVAVLLAAELHRVDYPYTYQIAQGLGQYLAALSGAFEQEHEQAQRENLRWLLVGIPLPPADKT